MLHLSADLSDDVGLDTAEFEMIISRAAGGEDFTFATTSFSRTKFGGAKRGRIEYTIPYANMRFVDSSHKSTPLQGGDQLSIRALVWDNNSLTGPGHGTSETRTIRFALKSEYDSLNINPAPPTADTALTTLRMLIMAVAKLDTVGYMHHTMDHKVYQDSAIKLGGIAALVRFKIEDIIAEQTGNGEIAINPLLEQAREAMTEAVTDLYIADTHSSLPPLYAAYKALQKYSFATNQILSQEGHSKQIYGEHRPCAASPAKILGVRLPGRRVHSPMWTRPTSPVRTRWLCSRCTRRQIVRLMLSICCASDRCARTQSLPHRSVMSSPRFRPKKTRRSRYSAHGASWKGLQHLWIHYRYGVERGRRFRFCNSGVCFWRLGECPVIAVLHNRFGRQVHGASRGTQRSLCGSRDRSDL